MKWDRDEVKRLLTAELFEEPVSPDSKSIVLRFVDHLMKYELWVFEANDQVFVAADSQNPIQGLPFFEASFPCVEIAPLVKGGFPVGLGIFSGPAGKPALQFSITRRGDGNISLSGAYSA